MMQEIRLDMPSVHPGDDNVKYYTALDSKRQRSSLSTSTTNSCTSNSTFMDEKQQKWINRRRCLAGALVITIVALSAFIVTAFIFDFPKFAQNLNNELAQDLLDNTTSKPTTSTTSEAVEKQESADSNSILEIEDTQPSGFAPQVDYLYADAVEAPEANNALPNVVSVVDNMTPELEKQLLEQLYKEFPEMFEQYQKEQAGNGELADMPQLPPGATGFSMHSQPNVDGFKLTPQEEGSGFFVYSPRFNAYDVNYELPAEPIIDEVDADYLPAPPKGAWEEIDTPPPPPMAERPKIIFQESAPSLDWNGPSDGTWFHQPIDFIQGQATPKESRIAAPWLGEDCSIVTALDGEKRVDGSAKCDHVVWYPYHYDVYPDSKPADWVYIEMKEGERNLIWPGAGPFRKIDSTPAHSSLRSGSICLDLPPMPFEYRGPMPDELDCAAMMMRVKGFGDSKEYSKVDKDMPVELQKSAWDFTWRKI